MKTDIELQADIVSELNWEPSIRNEDVAVAVKEGVVTLAGTLDSYAQRHAAERAVERVRGVKAVVNDLLVRLPDAAVRSDPEIAHAAVDALKWDVQVPHDRIQVKVSNGEITLEGEVQWYYQRMAADRAVRNLTGVRRVNNFIRVLQTATTADVKQRIREALRRQAEVDADQITVTADQHTVTLRGSVRTLAERRDAEYAAWRARGVTRVDNELVINPAAPAIV